MPSILDQIRITHGYVYDVGTLAWVKMTQPIIEGGSVTVSGTITSSETRPTTSAVTSVAASASTVSLLASNTSRRGAIIANDSTAILYLKLGATASTSSYTVQLFQDDIFELPFPVYTGAIDGIWGSATGNARITELT